jgi:hypothetical protein
MLSGRLREHDGRHRAGAAHLAVVRAQEEDRICGARPGASPQSISPKLRWDWTPM